LAVHQKSPGAYRGFFSSTPTSQSIPRTSTHRPPRYAQDDDADLEDQIPTDSGERLHGVPSPAKRGEWRPGDSRAAATKGIDLAPKIIPETIDENGQEAAHGFGKRSRARSYAPLSLGKSRRDGEQGEDDEDGGGKACGVLHAIDSFKKGEPLPESPPLAPRDIYEHMSFQQGEYANFWRDDA
jgi:hypothetical protein